jgi:hypothetical protein
MMDAQRSCNYATAREYALILRAWLRDGGFYPTNKEPDDVDAAIRDILKPACLPHTLSSIFGSMSCIFCDAGDEIGSVEAAIEAGWTKIQPISDMASTTHLAICPECRRSQDEDE